MRRHSPFFTIGGLAQAADLVFVIKFAHVLGVGEQIFAGDFNGRKIFPLVRIGNLGAEKKQEDQSLKSSFKILPHAGLTHSYSCWCCVAANRYCCTLDLKLPERIKSAQGVVICHHIIIFCGHEYRNILHYNIETKKWRTIGKYPDSGVCCLWLLP